ncbi:MAG: DUF819 family protein, partial [Acidimicrobiia bacterium]|nr:DUF819 family protein [Acidimicrobiia bacterium]
MDEATALLTDPMTVLAFLGAVVAVIFWLSSFPSLRALFDRTPPVMYVYFIPMLATTIGITPDASPVYSWTNRFLLPFALLLLMLSIDLKSVARLGPTALFMIVAGTIGIVIGAPVALLVFGGWLPDDAWMGFAALSGSWIGGTANMVAIADSVGMPESMYGPVIVVDTVVGYGWIGILLFFSAWQRRFDTAIKARTNVIEETNRRLEAMDSHRRPLELWHAMVLIGLGFGGAVLAVNLGDALPVLGDPTVISHTTWAILIVVTGGL